MNKLINECVLSPNDALEDPAFSFQGQKEKS